jgi:hypothetical protein
MMRIGSAERSSEAQRFGGNRAPRKSASRSFRCIGDTTDFEGKPSR